MFSLVAKIFDCNFFLSLAKPNLQNTLSFFVSGNIFWKKATFFFAKRQHFFGKVATFDNPELVVQQHRHCFPLPPTLTFPLPHLKTM